METVMTDTHTPIALITGGSRGLGRATALWLARKGADVILTYHSNREAAETTRAEIEAIGQKAEILQLDTGRVSDFPDFAARVCQRLQDVWKRSRLDFLVNNAGQGVYQRFEQTSEAEFDSLVDVHLKGVFFLTQALLPLIIDGGRIVNVSSGLTRITLPGFAAYATMKGAVEVLTRYLALELGERGITVNVLAPGAIETDFGGGMVRDNAEMNAQIAAVTALGRVGQPDDIGGALSSCPSSTG